MALSRRQFFTLAGAGAATTVLASPLEALYARVARGISVSGGGYGPLLPDPNKLLDLPEGFQYRAFSRTRDIMNDGNPVPDAHDGMAAFPGSNVQSLPQADAVSVGFSIESAQPPSII